MLTFSVFCTRNFITSDPSLCTTIVNDATGCMCLAFRCFIRFESPAALHVACSGCGPVGKGKISWAEPRKKLGKRAWAKLRKKGKPNVGRSVSNGPNFRSDSRPK